MDKIIKWSDFIRPRTTEKGRLTRLCDEAFKMVDAASSLKELRAAAKR